MGAHPKAPATAYVGGIAMPLDRLIAEAPDRILGPSASARFGGRLPYLFKVLDVASMLSIQVHPTKAQAAEGFARENAAGIDLGATDRNYKDQNHKPEVAVALPAAGPNRRSASQSSRVALDHARLFRSAGTRRRRYSGTPGLAP